MKKILASVLVAAMVIPSLCSCGTEKNRSDERTLNVLTWDGYIPENVIDTFESKTGIKMNFSNFNDNEEMLAKLSITGGENYDVVIASDYMIDIAAKQGLIKELDKEKIPNYQNINDVFLSQYYDPDNKYTVPYAPGTPLIVYDPNKIDIDIKGYSDLWNPALKNQLVLIDDARNIVGITLKTLGFSFNETDEEKLSAAREKLLELKDNVYMLTYNNSHEAIVSGEADIGYMFTPNVLLALEARPELKVVYPQEGMGFGIDSWFVPSGAEHVDEAYEFLNFILEPDIGASISEQIMYMCVNKASEQYLSEDFKNNPALYISSDILGTPEFIRDVGDKAALYDEIWTEFKQK